MEKATKILDKLDNLNKLIDDLDGKLTPYLLPEPNEKCEKEAVAEPEITVSPLEEYLMEVLDKSRNPLKSGQCFLPQLGVEKIENENVGKVAIPSNRVNVSYNVYI